MKKVKELYLNENNRLVLLLENGDQYQIDMEDFINPRWERVDIMSIHYSIDLGVSTTDTKGTQT